MKAVIFDCDGVLVDSEIISVEFSVAFLAELGLQYTQAEYIERFLGKSDKSFFAELETDARKRIGRSIMETTGGP